MSQRRLQPNLTGFSAASNRRLVSVSVVYLAGFLGWVIGGYVAAGGTTGGIVGAAVAAGVAIVVVFVPWWGQPVWSWALLALRSRRSVISWNDPITVANNRSGGGVRIEQQ